MRYIILILLFLVGCSTDFKVKHSKVVCDSGFSTEFMQLATINDGVIIWRAWSEEPTKYRKMLVGEICKVVHTTEEFTFR